MADNKTEVTFVPFPGGAPTTAAVMGRHVSVASASGEVLPHVKSGKLRVLAMVEDSKLKAFPDMQTVRELGYRWNLNSWVGIGGPAGMDPAVTNTLYEAFRKAMEAKITFILFDTSSNGPALNLAKNQATNLFF